MRARAIRRGVGPRSGGATGAASATTEAGRPSVAALVFLRGRDADGRLRELVAERARVWRALEELSRLREAVLSGEVS